MVTAKKCIGVFRMEFNEVLKNRRSIRKFKSEPVPENYIKELMEAARLAPSGLNLQPWRYIIVKDKTIREEVSKATPSTFAAVAPVLIICCMDTKTFETTGDRVKELHEAGAFSDTAFNKYATDDFFANKEVSEFWLQANLAMNTAISIEHIALKATDMGLGCCWIGSFDQQKIREIVGIEDRYNILALMPVGYPDQEARSRPRLSMDQIILKEV